METENVDKILEFLDVKISNNGEGKYEFGVYRKTAITNTQVKPSSSHDPKILEGIFKGFVHRARNICSEKYLKEELEFLVNVFIENGYERSFLEKVIKDVESKLIRTDENQTESLPTITLPWIPGVSQKLRKVYKKAGYRVAFKSNPNLQDILTKKNKVKLPDNSHPGVYSIPCGCGNVPPYIGQTKLQVTSRIDQHKDYVRKEKWDMSGIAQHSRLCSVGPLFDKTKTIKAEQNKFNRSVREALEIQKNCSGPKHGGINLDEGQYLKTTFWIPYMHHLTKNEKDRRNKINRINQQQQDQQ